MYSLVFFKHNACTATPRYLVCLRQQVPLDQILTSQKELLALQHIIQREAAAAHSRLQALATGSAAGAAAAAAAPAVLLPDVEGEGNCCCPACTIHSGALLTLLCGAVHIQCM
jgi:hypothetical protein